MLIFGAGWIGFVLFGSLFVSYRGETELIQKGLLRSGDFLDHYQVLRCLGQGGVGQVYLAYDTKLHRKVALKVVNPALMREAKTRERFLFEARATAQFNHTNIVTIYSVGEQEGLHYLTLEYLKGRTLREWIQSGEIHLREALRVGLDVLKALVEAHEQGVLHLDLKPENIFVTTEGRVCVLDFGLARLRPRWETPKQDDLNERTALVDMQSLLVSEAGGLQGTPQYMAPEQWLRAESAEATDVWAWAVVMVELLAGAHPYQYLEGNILSLALIVGGAEPVPMPVGMQVHSEELQGLLLQCLEKDPDARPSAATLVQLLESLLRPDVILGDERNPFRGLMSFSEEHADFFFGRSAEIAGFFEVMKAAPILPIVGPSGAGKSSFVKAGVLPRLREQGGWQILTIRPGAKPFRALASQCLRLEKGAWTPTEADVGSDDILALIEQTAGETLLDDDDEFVPPTMEQSQHDAGLLELGHRFRLFPLSLAAFLREQSQRLQVRLFLLIDQFEELFTLAEEEEAKAFLEAVFQAVDDPNDPVRVSFTLRHDFLPSLGNSVEVREALRHMTLLWSPGQEALRDVIVRPVERLGYRFDDPSMVDVMIEAVQGEAVGLPLLQFTLQMLWQRRDTNARLLRRASYEEIKGLEGALAQHADGVFVRLSEQELELGRSLLLRLVTSERTRRVLTQGQALDGLGIGALSVLRLLVEARLVSVNQRADDGVFLLELAHESLIHTWTRLRRWIEESDEDLAFLREVEESALLWERRGCPVEETWQGEALNEALRHLERCTLPVPPVVTTFLHKGRDRAKRRQVRERHIRRFSAVLLALVACLGVGAAWLFSQQSARDKKLRAQVQVEGARADLEGQRLFEARARLRSAFEVQDSTTGRLLWWKLKHQPLFWKSTLGGLPYSVFFSHEGKQVIAACMDRTIYLYNTKTRARRLLRGHKDQVISAALVKKGKGLLSSSWDGEVLLWEQKTGRFRLLFKTKSFFRELVTHPSKAVTAGGTNVGDLYVWFHGQMEKPLVLRKAHRQMIKRVRFHPTLPLLFTYGSDQHIRMWRYTSSQIKPLADAPLLRSSDNALAISNDGRWLAHADKSRYVLLRDTKTFGLSWRIDAHEGNILALLFHPDGRTLISLGWDNKIHFWDRKKRKRTKTFLIESPPAYASLSPDGRHLITSSLDQSIRLWKTNAQPLRLRDRKARKYADRALFLENLNLIALATNDGSIQFRDIDTGDLRFVLTREKGKTIKAFLYTPSNRRLYAAAIDGRIDVWDLSTRKLLATLRGHKGEVHALALLPGGTKMLSGSYDGSVWQWDLTNHRGERLIQTDPHLPILDFSLHGASQRLIISGKGSRLQLWKLEAKKRIRLLESGKDVPYGIHWMADGKLAFTVHTVGYLKMWNLSNETYLGLEPYASRVVGYSFGRLYHIGVSPGQSFLASGSSKGLVYVWKIKAGAKSGQARVMWGHSGEVNNVKYHPNGKLLVSVSDDGTTRTWWSHKMGPHLYGQPYWRTSLFLPGHKEAFTHKGWQSLSTLTKATPAKRKWRRVIEKHTRLAHVDEASGRLCLSTYDGHVELWDMERDRRLVRRKILGVRQVLAAKGRCWLRALAPSCTKEAAKGRCNPNAPGHLVAIMLHRKLRTKVLQDKATSLSSSGGGVLVVSGRRLVSFDGKGKRLRTEGAPVGVSAVLRTLDFDLFGFANGSLELFLKEKGKRRRASFSFEGTPARAVVSLIKGPGRTIFAGYANGFVGLWSLDNGARLFYETLHGAVPHLAFRGGFLYGASTLGELLTRDLRIFDATYCDILRDIWRDIPVLWGPGFPVAHQRPSSHPCSP